MDSFNIPDKLIYTLCSYPKMKNYINCLLSFYDIQETTLGKINFIENLSKTFDLLVSSSKIQFITSLILSIANYIHSLNNPNKQKMNSFCFSSLESVIEIKNKNKNIFDIISKYYLAKYGNETILNQNQKKIMNSLVDILSEKTKTISIDMLKNNYLLIYEEIERIGINNNLKCKLNDDFVNRFYKEIFIEKYESLQKNEVLSRDNFAKWFLCEINNVEMFNKEVVKIFKIIIQIDNKLSSVINVMHPKTNKDKSKGNKFKEKDAKSINTTSTNTDSNNNKLQLTINTTSSSMENPEKLSFIFNNNKIHKDKNGKFCVTESSNNDYSISKRNKSIISKDNKHSLLSNKYKL